MHRTDWFMKKGWGVLCHYLASHPGDISESPERDEADISVDEWNRRIDSFRASDLADQLQECGAGYLFLTIGQNSGFYCSPNETYDSFVQRKPSRCSQRDLIMDLAMELEKRDIRMMAYLPAGAPAYDEVAAKALEWEDGFHNPEKPDWLRDLGKGLRLESFQRKWESIILEWGKRWGRHVHGWWIDGCYFPESMYDHADPPNMGSFAAALRAGNPDRILGFNYGPRFRQRLQEVTEHGDFTAGHSKGNGKNGFLYACPGRWVGADQYHVLQILGEDWGRGDPTFPDGFLVAYLRYLRDRHGVITFDVPIGLDGILPDAFVDQLSRSSSVERAVTV